MLPDGFRTNLGGGEARCGDGGSERGGERGVAEIMLLAFGGFKGSLEAEEAGL